MGAARDALRGGTVPESLFALHRTLLRTQWWRLPTPELWSYLYRIVGAEHSRYANVISGVRHFGDRRLQPQLRWRRLAVARELRSRGVDLDLRLFDHGLQLGKWPGLAKLMPMASKPRS